MVVLVILGWGWEKEVGKEKRGVEGEYKVVWGRMEEGMGVLEDVEEGDDNVYGVILEGEGIG